MNTSDKIKAEMEMELNIAYDIVVLMDASNKLKTGLVKDEISAMIKRLLKTIGGN